MNFLSLLEMTWLVAQMKDSEISLTGYKYLTGHNCKQGAHIKEIFNFK